MCSDVKQSNSSIDETQTLLRPEFEAEKHILN